MQILSGVKVCRAARYANPGAGMTMGALTDRAVKQANTAAEKEQMLKRESFPPNDNDQNFELPRSAKRTHACHPAIS